VFAVVTQDAAGNRTLVWQRLVASRGQHTSTITARLKGTDGQIVPRSRYAIVGKLTDRTTAPIPGARVELIALSRTATAVPTRAAVVTTDSAGRWRVGGLRAADGSRIYVARHLDDTGAATVSSAVRATVAIDLTARVRRTAAGRIVAGRVTAPAASAELIRLLLASRRLNGWRTERSTRTSPNRHFALRVPGRVRGRLALFVAPSPDLPYAPAGRVVDLARP